MVLGHEITGEVIECGSDVEFIKEGDLCSVPFNIACGRYKFPSLGFPLKLIPNIDVPIAKLVILVFA